MSLLYIKMYHPEKGFVQILKSFAIWYKLEDGYKCETIEEFNEINVLYLKFINIQISQTLQRR